MMLLKETTRHRSKIFHICDAYDIASVKCQLEMEEADSLNRFKVFTQDRASVTSKEETKQADNSRASLIKEDNPLYAH